MKFVSIFIIAFISLLVFTMAALILFVSLKDPYSNVHIAEKVIHRVIAEIHRSNQTAQLLADTASSAGDSSSVCSDSSCKEPTSGLSWNIEKCALKTPDSSIVSIVQFLKDRHMAYTFESRTTLALRNGIVDYRGSAEQNRNLIRILQEQLCN